MANIGVDFSKSLITSKEIMEYSEIKFGKSKVTDILKRLANKNLVVIEGTGRGTKYRIKS